MEEACLSISRFIAQHAAYFRVFISILFAMVGVLLSDTLPFEEIFVRSWLLSYVYSSRTPPLSSCSVYIKRRSLDEVHSSRRRFWGFNPRLLSQLKQLAQRTRSNLKMHPFASLTTLLSAFRLTCRIFISLLCAIVGVVLSDSGLLEASSAILDHIILPVILIIYANAATLVIPSDLLRSTVADNLRFFAQHVAFGVFISKLLNFIRICFPAACSSPFDEIYVRLGAVILCVSMYNAQTIYEIFPLVDHSTIVDLLRSIPRHEMFAVFIQELTCIVQRWYINSPPLEENSARTWIFQTSARIYNHTGDVVSGSLACTTLISFLISRHEAPIYVFIVWAIGVLSCLKINGVAIPRNDRASATHNGSTSV